MSEFIPIDDIESQEDATAGREVVPEVLRDDPDLGDGSSGRTGVNIAPWRLHTLREDSLVGMTEYDGDDRWSRKARRAQQASREARTSEERKQRRQKRVKVAFVLVFLLALVASVGATYGLELWGGKTVPSVEGLPQSYAVELLEQKGFSVKLETAPADVPEGRVVEVSPASGDRVAEGSEIKVTIGTSRILPEVVGLSEDEALAALEEAGAQNVRVESILVNDADEGTVREVRPAAGSVFISTDEITLQVNQLPRVPEVVGKTQEEALAEFEKASIPVNVTKETGTAEQRLKVMRVDPDVGERVESGQTVEVVVGEALIDPVRVGDYFDSTAAQVRTFLEGKGYALKAAIKKDDRPVARFEGSNDARISLLREPWTHAADQANGMENVLTEAPVDGVRLEVSISREQTTATSATTQTDEDEIPSGRSKGLELLGLESAPVDEETAQAVATLCGFGEAQSACTQDTITLPPGVGRSGHSLYCCQGETDGRVWTVLVAGADEYSYEASRIVVTCVPKSYFSVTDLSESGERICDFVAYVDEYTS